MEDGQFDECDLTLRDISRAQEAFVTQLLGMYHQRVAYPQSKVVEIESRRAAGGGEAAASRREGWAAGRTRRSAGSPASDLRRRRGGSTS